MTRSYSVLAFVVLASLQGACVDSKRAADSNTNWLRECDGHAECGGEDMCVCGVCTVACADDATCSRAEGPDAFCVALDEGQCAGAHDAVCLQSCARDSDCEDGLLCGEGACQERARSGDGGDRDASA